MKTFSYVGCEEEEIKVGEEYLFGQLWNGNGNGEGLLNSGSIAIDIYNTLSFNIIHREDEIMDTLVQITGVY